VLIDASAWITAMREGGDESVRARVAFLTERGTAAWCAPIRLELWPGAKGRKESEYLRDLMELVADLEITAAVWNQAIELAVLARRSGLNCPYPDFLVVACSRIHRVELLHCDKHFDLLAKL